METLPDGRLAIWRTSLDNRRVYSVTEIKPEPEPEPTDPLILLRQALAS